MNLSDQKIHDFIEAWRKDFGETLSFEAGKLEATRLIEFFIQMEDALLMQRALANKASRPPAPPSIKEHGAKPAWRKTMRQRSNL